MKKLLAAVILVGTSAMSWAQTKPVRPPSIGVSLTLNDFQTPERIRSTSLSKVLANEQWSKLREMSPGVTVTYFQGMNPHIDFAGSLGFAFARINLPNKPSTSSKMLLEADASFNFKMFPDNYLLSPYLIAGVGGSRYGSSYGAFLPLGGGLKLNILEEASVFTTFQYRIPLTTETNNYHFVASFGIAGIIGSRKPEPKPIEPPPADRDGDGIIDLQDQCPDVPGLAAYKGCPIPDTDGDGLNDSTDKCPTVAGTAKYEGCPVPDTDSDGINDEADKCPSVAGVERYQGCPVPDTDNDGVNDEEDKCPTVPGIAANNGCPEIRQEVVERINYASKNIFFITGSSKLSSKSYPALDEVAKILGENTAVKLSIEGHTDNVGKAEYNQKLSEDRAASVKAYLVSKGVDEARLNAAGFGLTQPVADNKTAAGRAKNRRVELKLGYE